MDAIVQIIIVPVNDFMHVGLASSCEHQLDVCVCTCVQQGSEMGVFDRAVPLFNKALILVRVSARQEG